MGTCIGSAAVEVQGVNGAKRHSMRIAIGIATVARQGVLLESLRRIARQSRPPDAIVVCTPCNHDTGDIAAEFPQVTMIEGPRGSSHQRNAIIAALAGFDAVLFMDDDFIPSADYVAELEEILLLHTDIVMVTGLVVADGVVGPGMSFEQADAVLARIAQEAAALPYEIEEVFNGYGCNMAVRLEQVRSHSVAFDENLPLYAWLEDVDFSRQLAPLGRIVKACRLRGVHLGVKVGRQSGHRLGYSQIANPVYLIKKGTCSFTKGAFLMSRNVAANLVRSLRPEPWVDRTGRLYGNWRAIFDLMLGRLRPDRILTM